MIESRHKSGQNVQIPFGLWDLNNNWTHNPILMMGREEQYRVNTVNYYDMEPNPLIVLTGAD